MPATKAAAQPIPSFGAVVTYHGTVTAAHGSALLHDWCDCDECWDHNLTRYVLIPLSGSGELRHVRVESFT